MHAVTYKTYVRIFVKNKSIRGIISPNKNRKRNIATALVARERFEVGVKGIHSIYKRDHRRLHCLRVVIQLFFARLFRELSEIL